MIDPSFPPPTIREPARETAVAGQFDVIVCGGGPAGFSAAVAAARDGARTLLLEAHGALGGVWTSGLLSWVIDAGNRGGIMAEIIRELDQRGARLAKAGRFSYDVEAMKRLLEEMVLRAGVFVQLHTHVVSARVSAEKRLEGVITESKSGRQAWLGKVFIDATGDGDLGAAAGCGFDLGEPGTGRVQPMSLIALITGVHRDGIGLFIGGGDAGAKARLFEEMQRAGTTPSYGSPTIFPVRDDLFALMANHLYGYSALDAREVTLATLEAREELHRIVEALRARGGPWGGLRIVATAEQIGIREGRRLHGLYTVTAEDLARGARHPDAACRCSFGVDIHSTDPARGSSYDKSHGVRAKPYDIPLRALIARDVEGLLMAGRCISGDFIAHSSYRVTGNAVAMGEAAGHHAAFCAKAGVPPRASVETVTPEVITTL